jgi:hypothetical protein
LSGFRWSSSGGAVVHGESKLAGDAEARKEEYMANRCYTRA